MSVKNFLSSFDYQYARAPWDAGGSCSERGELLEGSHIPTCRVIDLGSGTAINVIYLAQHGFDVTGVDYLPAALEMGRVRAREAGVAVMSVEDGRAVLEG
ncbi:MAG: methyltransferase domain-containing protein [Candidatus Promineifilaceae bacterium]